MSHPTKGRAPTAGIKTDGRSSDVLVQKYSTGPLKTSPKRDGITLSSPREGNVNAGIRTGGLGGMAEVTVMAKREILEERAKRLGERYGLDLNLDDFLSIDPNDTVLRVDKPIRMRVRCICHKCDALFTTKNACPKCHHIRCDKCPRYPPKHVQDDIIASLQRMEVALETNKENPHIIVADSFWGDRNIELKRPSKTGGQDLVHRKPRQRIRRTCHECRTFFASGCRKCEQCGHIRCTDCPRDPPKKDKYPFGYPGDEFGPDSEARFECNVCETLFDANVEDGTPCPKCGLEKSGESPRALPRKVQPTPDPDVLNKLQARLDGLRTSTSNAASS